MQVAKGQTGNIDSAYFELATWFDAQVGTSNKQIYTGRIYQMVTAAGSNSQFLHGMQWQNGTINYKGNTYFDLDLAYDIEKNILVVRNPIIGRRDGVVLDMTLLGEFVINGDHFIRHDNQHFHLLYSGSHFDVIAKRSKKLSQNTSGAFYNLNSSLYLRSNDKLVLLKNAKSLDDISSQRKSISKTISKKYSSRFRVNNERLLLKFLNHFDNEMAVN